MVEELRKARTYQEADISNGAKPARNSPNCHWRQMCGGSDTFTFLLHLTDLNGSIVIVPGVFLYLGNWILEWDFWVAGDWGGQGWRGTGMRQEGGPPPRWPLLPAYALGAREAIWTSRD